MSMRIADGTSTVSFIMLLGGSVIGGSTIYERINPAVYRATVYLAV